MPTPETKQPQPSPEQPKQEEPKTPESAEQEFREITGVTGDKGKPEKPITTNIINLVPTIPKDKLKEMGETVCQWFDIDKESLTEWEKKRARWYKLWSGSPSPKNYPWPGCSNVIIPLVKIACNQTHSRLYQSIFTPERLAKFEPVMDSDRKKARLKETWVNRQMRVEIPDYEDRFDQMLLQLTINGMTFRKGFWNSELECPEIVNIPATSICLPYNTQSIETARRISQVLKLHDDEMQERADSGYYDAKTWDSIAGKQNAISNQTPLETVQDKISGQLEPSGIVGKQDSVSEIPRMVLECHCKYKLKGQLEPCIITVDYDSKKVLRITSRAFKNNYGEDKTLNYFLAYKFLPNPEGFYGFGYGHDLEHLNEIQNTMFNMSIDSAKLSNMPWVMVDKTLGLNKSELLLRPGAVNNVQNVKGFSVPQLQRVGQEMFQLMGMVDRYVEKDASIADYMQGRDKSRPGTAGGVTSIIQQGLTSFNVIAQRVFRQFAKELQLIDTLNQIYLTEKKQVSIMGEDGIPYPALKRKDMEFNYHIIPVGDPSYANQQDRLNKAMMKYQIVGKDPLTAQNPKARAYALDDLLTEMNVKDKKKYLPDMPDDSIDPVDEEIMFIKGDYHEPQKGENHMAHLVAHEGFIHTPLYTAMPSDYKELVHRHIKETMATAHGEVSARMQMGAMGSMGMPPKQGQPVPPEGEPATEGEQPLETPDSIVADMTNQMGVQ